MSDYTTVGYRVSWLQSHHFAGEPPTQHSSVVETRDEVLEMLQSITKRQPITERPTYRPQVVELRQYVETREVPVGLSGWELS